MSPSRSRRLAEITAAARATVDNLRSSDRKQRIASPARLWTFAAADRLDAAPLVELFPGIEATRCGATPENRHHYELPYGERFTLDVITRYLRARTVFEFGTYRGATTLLLADAVGSDGTVHTIDLPRRRGVAPEDDVIGEALRRTPPTGATVIEHRVGTAAFDFEPWIGGVDLVLIDASHERPDVLRDSWSALRLVRPGGVVVWDDYHAAQPGVVAAINEVSERVPVHRVAWTRLAVAVVE
jgi:predicted O-methyltransferase YrrM